METANIFNEFVLMDGRTRTNKDGQRSLKATKKKEIVESYISYVLKEHGT